MNQPPPAPRRNLLGSGIKKVKKYGLGLPGSALTEAQKTARVVRSVRRRRRAEA